MTWIQTIEPDEAEGEIADIYRAIAAGLGGVAAVHRAQSLNIRALRAHLDLYKAVVFQRSTLSRIARERIARRRLVREQLPLLRRASRRGAAASGR